ncbi:hypothetical protein L2E82_48186 [Cichorium intybus]|uniref:Uncharacterized protein n=1 Tax=Cichorium intybus TaxID=13427 RepID=A0ACB8YYT5_CICIN|nr:hypothetical protein L2E82_48186 [Cichorium intybus]
MVGKVDAAKPDPASMSTTFSFENLKLNEATRVVDPSHNPYFNYQTTLYLTEKGLMVIAAIIYWTLKFFDLRSIFARQLLRMFSLLRFISIEEYLQQVRDGNGFCCLRSSER